MGDRVDCAADDRHRVRLAQIDAYIWRNLGDPHLSPPVVAAANHISLRYLHGIGPHLADVILTQLGIDGQMRANKLTEDNIAESLRDAGFVVDRAGGDGAG